jgi:hypothetical protein
MTKQGITTEELARALGIRAHTLHEALCRRGHYFGLRPLKLPNRYLLWPADSVERLLSQRNSAA